MAIDLAIGLTIYFVISWLFSEPFTWSFFGIAIAGAFAPDIDFIVYNLFRRRFQWVSHHLIHFPILFVGVAVLIGLLLPTEKAWYGVTLFLVGIFLHFIHDMWTSQQGIRWLWPLYDFGVTMKRFDQPGQFGIVSALERREMYQGWRIARQKTGGCYPLMKEFTCRWEAPGVGTTCWVLGMSLTNLAYAQIL